ncbi:MAG: DUF2283 domain-containing protein, partial [Synergistaceae bacterium]|nr:DUF2283 domain-containing protein [Synergistaceae bacterium]
MIVLNIESGKVNYDRDHDVLRIRFPLPSDAFSYDDEEYPGIYVSRSEKD